MQLLLLRQHKRLLLQRLPQRTHLLQNKFRLYFVQSGLVDTKPLFFVLFLTYTPLFCRLTVLLCRVLPSGVVCLPEKQYLCLPIRLSA